jgi:prenyltransferase beta subunit
MLITDGVEENEDEGRLLAVEVEETEEEVQGEISVMSLQQLGQLGQMGTNKPQSIQLKGTVQGVPVLILVDSGATHNFVDKKLVKKMN